LKSDSVSQVSDFRPLGPLVRLNNLSRTARPISTKFSRKRAWGDGDSDLFK